MTAPACPVTAGDPARIAAGGAPGRGAITVARGPRGSVVTRAFAASPLKWLTPRNGGGAAWLFAASYGGGLVAGDRLDLDVRVDPGASAFLSTQASTKVYRSETRAEVSLRARVAAGGLLVSVPDPVVCFAESAYRQVQAFELEAGASLVAVDWMTSGRLGSGERWAFIDYASTTTLRLEGRLALHDAVRLSRRDGDLATRLGRFDVLALAAIAGDPLAIEAARVVETVADITPARRPEVMVSAAALPGGGGCVVRLAGQRVEAVRQRLRALLEFVPALLGDDPWARKW